MPKDIGKTLKECRASAKISVKEISDLLTQKGYKASESTIYSWENGNSQPTPGALLTMCKIYGINNVLDTFGYDGYKEDSSLQLNMSEVDMIEKFRSLDPYRQETVSIVLDREYHTAHMLKNADWQESVQAPVIDIQPKFGKNGRLIEYFHSASAGSGVYILGNEVANRIQIPDTDEYKEVDYAIKVRGDSMLPDYCNGDIALVSQRKEMQIGDIGIFVKNGDTYIKELGKDKLISKNDHYPNIPVTDLDNIVCMGKVVGKLKSNLDLSEEDISLLHEARNRLVNNDSNSKK